MQPPANAVQPHNHHLPPPPLAAAPPSAPMQPHHHHHHQHVHHAVGDIGSLARRHGCSTSAFSAPPPPATGGCGTQTLHHMPPEHGYVQGKPKGCCYTTNVRICDVGVGVTAAAWSGDARLILRARSARRPVVWRLAAICRSEGLF